MRLGVRCPAKVNLHLEVLGRRPDGFHELRTLFAAAGVWDEVTFEAAPAGVVTLAVEPAGAVAGGEENLVMRAARALAERLGGAPGARMVLRKRIPVAGGLGGGSSDAAAALVGLAALWGHAPADGELATLAARLGADVPFFLTGGAAWGIGRGSDVTPLPDLPPWWVLLLPGVEPVPTAEVYRGLDPAALDAGGAAAIYRWVTGGGALPLESCRNDLQPTVVSRWPEVGRRLAGVAATRPMLALVSGSGGTVFGLFDGEGRARQAAAATGFAGAIVAPLLTRAGSVLRASVLER